VGWSFCIEESRYEQKKLVGKLKDKAYRKMFENRLLKGIFRPKGDEVTSTSECVVAIRCY
jgi:hypothetical protein